MWSTITSFVFWYPIIMSILWMSGGVLFYLRRERKHARQLTVTPFVSILVPCYNEQETVEETIGKLHELNYPNYEIIAINDGSRDKTSYILKRLILKYSKLRVVNLKVNSGKANALHAGLTASKGEYIICVDADAYLDKDALNYIMPHFTTPRYGERVGAVTGNPRVRNRNSLLARIQICEYASIIGLIKRTQRIFGKVMTVSGVVVAFRKRALLDCGLWDRDLITEDIGITWKLQKRFWDIRYEPKALCWMLVPETLKGLWNQRVRWAQGGTEVILRHWTILSKWKQRRLIPVLLEQILSGCWALSWIVTCILFIWNFATGHHVDFSIFWSALLLFLICMFQFGIAFVMEFPYEKGILKYYFWAIWYPVFYWYFNAFVFLRALPKAFFNKKYKYAVWESPDRGIVI